MIDEWNKARGNIIGIKISEEQEHRIVMVDITVRVMARIMRGDGKIPILSDWGVGKPIIIYEDDTASKDSISNISILKNK